MAFASRPSPSPPVVRRRELSPYVLGRLSTGQTPADRFVSAARHPVRGSRSAGVALLALLLLAALLAVAAVVLSGWMWTASARAETRETAAGEVTPAQEGAIVFATDGRAARDIVAGGSSLAAGRVGGYVAPPVSVPAGAQARLASVVRSWPERFVAPAAFDLRLRGKVGPVRDQGRFGTCWAFAALGSLESALLPEQPWDLSENNMVARSGFDLSYSDGGNSRMATAYLTRWAGPVTENDDRYGRPGASPVGLPERLHVHDVLFLPPRTGPSDNENLKWAIATYGAVDVSMYWDDYCYDRRLATFYYRGTGLNHDVTCVGWDDGYPAARFEVRPPGDGAFLVRNSWGRGFGDGGYFWVSYYDSAFATDAAVFCAARVPGDYSAVYGHDDLGWVDSAGFSGARGTAWFAARHTVVSGGALAAVAFYTPTASSSYEVFAGPSLAELSTVPLASGTIAAPGYHTVDLGQQVPLTAGADFVVAVKLTTPGFAWPIAVERAYQGYASPATAPGQSFVSSDGRRWTDVGAMDPSADVCLKAFTVGELPRATPPTTVLDSCRGPRGGKARIVFHVAHAAPGPAGVTVSLKVLSGTGRVVERIVLRDVPSEERRVVSCSTRLRSGRYRVVTSAVDTDGHRQVSPLSTRVRLSSSR